VKIDDISNALITLVRVGVIARFIFCMIKIAGTDEEISRYKKRAVNAVIFFIISECVWILKDVALYYYK